MGWEYFAALGEAGAAMLPQAAATAAESLGMTMLSRDERQVVLRWSPSAAGAPFEPDLWVYAHEGGCMVTFHVFSGLQREQFLAVLARNLSDALGEDVRFEDA